MSTAPTSTVSPEVRSLLAGLRWRIRAYVLLEGLALAVIWVGVLFWAVLALDYLPILVGASEMPQAVRGVLLGVTVVGLLYITSRWIVSRLFTRMTDRNMAVLLERRFPGFRDSLVTTVELAETPEHATEFNPAMLARTNADAVSSLADVKLREVFNFRPLLTNLVTAGLLIASLGLFGAINAPALGQAARRIWLLDSEPWPRSAQIEIVGIEIQRPTTSASAQLDSPLLRFEKGRLKVAKGANVVLKVRANAAAKYVPDYCTIYYRTDDGDRGRVQMKKLGRVKEEEIDGETRKVQNFSFDAKPFKGILSTTRFDVVGFDHRLSDYQIEVVESPALVETNLACEFPDYMVDPDTSSWLPRTVPYLPSGTQLPRGTKITLLARSNKPLRQVLVLNPESGDVQTVNISGTDENQKIELPLPPLNNNLLLELTLQDSDNVLSDRPQRIAITAINDDAPRVDAKLKGIGSAVTADVVIPVLGKITDDYGVAKSWFDLIVSDSEPRQIVFPLGAQGALSTEIDFRDQRALPNGIKLAPKDKLVLKIQAEDKCNLATGPNIGNGDTYQIDVVTPEELLSQLEVRELSLRRRFEQIISEMTEMRDSLLRVKINEGAETEKGSDPADKKATEKKNEAAPAADANNDEPSDKRTPAERAQALRLLRVQRAVQQTQKSAGEVLGVSLAFAEIREELINNRIDTEDRKERLKEQIADPLRQIVDKSFQDLDSRLSKLEKLLEKNPPETDTTTEATDAAIKKSEDVLLELNEVLQRMLDLETYNELLDIVRDLIKEQKELIDKTKQQQKKQLQDLSK